MNNKNLPPAPLPFRILRSIFPILETLLPFLARFIVVRLFFTPFKFKPRAEEVEVQATGKRHDFKANGNNVVFHSWGNSGPIAVLVHGWSGRGMQLRKFVAPLQKQGYQVISFDAPGHGASEGKESSLLEIRATLIEIEKHFGEISMGVGHSLGGAAIIYSAKEGLHFDKIITMSTPSIPDKIIDEFLRRINGSIKSGIAIDNYVMKRTGNHFPYYSARDNAKHISHIPLLSFHDKNDREAEIEHAYALQKAHGKSELVVTEGLGHNRILKDEGVLEKALEFSISEKEFA
ncbi:MAG: alpha/beta fold hydrolase [Salibacteraceae bacterium]